MTRLAFYGLFLVLVVGCGGGSRASVDANGLDAPDVALAKEAGLDVKDASRDGVGDAGGDASAALAERDANSSEILVTDAPSVTDAVLDSARADIDIDVGADATAVGDRAIDTTDIAALLGASLQLWFRGDRNVDCVPQEDLNRVSVWHDLSSHGRDARPPAGKVGPACGPSANLINGNRVVTFPRTTGKEAEEHLEVDLGSLVGRPFTIAIVEKRTGAEPRSYMMGSKLPLPATVDCAGNPNVGRGLLFGYQVPAIMVASTWGENCDLTYPSPPDPEKASASFFVYSPPAGFSLFVDGVQQTGAGAGLQQISALIGRGFELTGEAPDSRYHGDIAEILVLDTAIAEAARKQLESYFRVTWDTLP